MKKFLRRFRSVLTGLAFAGMLVLALLHQAPGRHSQPAEFDPISYHPYVTHAAGETKTARPS